MNRKELNRDVIDHMTTPKMELLKELIYLKYVSGKYDSNIEIAMELNVSLPCFYKYQKIALNLYDYTNRRVYKN